MSQGTKIAWTTDTWNPVVGCQRVSPGCENCYAERITYRLGRNPVTPQYKGLARKKDHGEIRWFGKARFVPEALTDPLHLRRPRRIFVCSMSDLFHADIDDEQIAAVFGIMAATPQHTFQVLTKRPERMLRWFRWAAEKRAGWMRGASFNVVVNELGLDMAGARFAIYAQPDANFVDHRWPLPNVHIGVSVEDQERADQRIPYLLEVPAAVRWLSCEPLLGRVYLRSLGDGIGWVVVGGESGPSARPMDVAWARSLVMQCQLAGVPVFVKQLGSHPHYLDGPARVVDGRWRWQDIDETGRPRVYEPQHRQGGDPDEWPQDLRVREYPGATPSAIAHAPQHVDVTQSFAIEPDQTEGTT